MQEKAYLSEAEKFNNDGLMKKSCK